MATPEESIPTEDVAKGPTDVEQPAVEATPTVNEPAAESTNTEATIGDVPAPAPIAGLPESEPVESAEPPAPPREREMVVDARLSVLRGMFPDFDDSLLQSVLDSVQGNTDRAIDALLGMSDPDYTSEHPVEPQVQAPQTQEELDEQLARTLMLEDEREQHAWRAQQQQPPQQRPPTQRRASEGPERDTMAEFTEQFNKIAESGKKTIGSLFSKVKAKIQEFDQPAGQSSPDAAYGTGGDMYPYDTNQHPFPAVGAQYNTYQSQQQQQQSQSQAQTPAYYDPNAPTNTSPTAAGYDAAPSMNPAGSAPSSPPTTNAGRAQIDGGKLGMLPKRPVSLLRTNSPPTGTPSGAPQSSDDELEYAENPFEEGRK